jgi:hypothetical protein
MRDAAILDMQQKNARRSGLMLAQFEVLKVRQDAGDLLLQATTLKDRLIWALWPAVYFKARAGVEQQLLTQARAQMSAAAARDKIQIVPAATVVSRG